MKKASKDAPLFKNLLNYCIAQFMVTCDLGATTFDLVIALLNFK